MYSNQLPSIVSRKHAVIFDLFHTLTAPEIVCPGGPSTSEILGLDSVSWNRQLMEKSKDRLRGLEKDPVSIIEKLAHAIHPGIPEELILKAVKNRIQRFESALVNIPECAVEVIKELKKRGKKIALVSNADVIESAAWKRSPVSPYFDVVLFSCEVGYVKPELEIYELCLEQLQEKPEDCLFVGDGGSNEFEGAKKAGLPCIMITGIAEKIWPEKMAGIKLQADFVIRTLDELI
jgi:putative hydrolase of the HAD superfamily